MCVCAGDSGRTVGYVVNSVVGTLPVSSESVCREEGGGESGGGEDNGVGGGGQQVWSSVCCFFQRRSLQAASGDVLSRWENEMRGKLVSYLQLEEGKLMPPE